MKKSSLLLLSIFFLGTLNGFSQKTYKPTWESIDCQRPIAPACGTNAVPSFCIGELFRHQNTFRSGFCKTITTLVQPLFMLSRMKTRYYPASILFQMVETSTLASTGCKMESSGPKTFGCGLNLEMQPMLTYLHFQPQPMNLQFYH